MPRTFYQLNAITSARGLRRKYPIRNVVSHGGARPFHGWRDPFASAVKKEKLRRIASMDTLGFEPRAFRMQCGCDTTTPCARPPVSAAIQTLDPINPSRHQEWPSSGGAHARFFAGRTPAKSLILMPLQLRVDRALLMAARSGETSASKQGRVARLHYIACKQRRATNIMC